MTLFENINFYTINDVAVMLNVNPRSVYRWVVKGILPGYKFKGSYRVTREDVLHFIERSKIKPSTH